MTPSERYHARLDAMTDCYDALLEKLNIQRSMVELLSNKGLLAPGYPGATVDDGADDLVDLLERLSSLSKAMDGLIQYGEAKEQLYSKRNTKPDLKIVKTDR